MKRFPVLLLCSGVVALAGCATGTNQAPVSDTYPITRQHRMLVAHHWEVFAESEASRIIEAVKDKSKPIYVEPPEEGGSAFAAAYYNMLQEYLVKAGATVVDKCMFGGVTVSYVTQVVTHNDLGYLASVVGIPSDSSVLTEVIITTHVLEGDLVLMSNSDVFYFNQGDMSHYLSKAGLGNGQVFQVVDQ